MPLLVRRIRPLAPQTQACELSRAATPRNESVRPPELWRPQLAPPSVVCRIAPPCPTIQPLFASAKSIPYRMTSLGDGCWVQVLPASMVFKIRPLSPTIQPALELTKRTACRLKVLLPVPGDCVNQVRPPSPVCRMVPPDPTTQPSKILGKETPSNCAPPAIPGFCPCQVTPPSLVESTFAPTP